LKIANRIDFIFSLQKLKKCDAMHILISVIKPFPNVHVFQISCCNRGNECDQSTLNACMEIS
jgi:hypothetical protein